jgi:hypothetical protein
MKRRESSSCETAMSGPESNSRGLCVNDSFLAYPHLFRSSSKESCSSFPHTSNKSFLFATVDYDMDAFQIKSDALIQ